MEFKIPELRDDISKKDIAAFLLLLLFLAIWTWITFTYLW